MTEAMQLRRTDRVLEIGTGSGYAAAVLSKLVQEVYSAERLAGLAETAQATLRRLGYVNVRVLCRDGTLGWKENAPYDAISVTAGGPSVPEALLDQLKIGGRLVMPVGDDRHVQELICVVRRGEKQFDREDLGGVCFVPLIGAEGWTESNDDETD
jgi:protein-L-isoaspartate(D-aspartate) O-methyltransferase